MENNPDASFYTLDVSVAPGGAREALKFALGSLSEIQRALEVCLSPAYGGVHLTVFYGRTILLRTTVDGRERTPPINLLPAITFQAPGYPEIGLDENGAPTGLSDGQQAELRRRMGGVAPEIGEEAVGHHVDWGRVTPPPLAGNPLRPGQRTWDADGEVIGYGLNDGEQGLFYSDWDSPDPQESTETLGWEDEWLDAVADAD